MPYKILFLLVILFIPSRADSQIRPALAHQIDAPLHIPLYLSANFGELRNNHFHTGLDFKTQGVTGKPVFSIDDGYVSRIGVSPWGYGLALYIDHPSGVTTVYGHLDRFSASIAQIVKARQYEAESYQINLTFAKDEIPVSRGELVAYAGNSGSSGGPHLHFEIRETATERTLDPLPYYRNRLQDNRAPKINSLMVYPVSGLVNGSRFKKKVGVSTAENGKLRISLPLEAWGDIALGVKANDYMDKTSNVYGVYSVELKVDSQLIFASKIDGVSFDENRGLNSFVDYEEWITNRSFVMKSFVDPGNKLSVYTKVENSGIIRIDQERDYPCVYILRDGYNNKTELHFKIRGVKQKLPEIIRLSDEVLKYNRANQVKKPGMTLDIPKGALYADLDFEYGQSDNPRYLSAIHKLHRPTVPLHLNATLAVKIQNDTVKDKNQYYLARTDKGDSPLKGQYKKGVYQADIRYLGSYAVRADQTPPQVTPVSAAQWGRNGTVRVRIGDSQSGVETYRGEIDGAFVLLELDGKTSVLTYRLESDRIKKGKQHQFNLVVTDACGNQKHFSNSFYW